MCGRRGPGETQTQGDKKLNFALRQKNFYSSWIKICSSEENYFFVASFPMGDKRRCACTAHFISIYLLLCAINKSTVYCGLDHKHDLPASKRLPEMLVDHYWKTILQSWARTCQVLGEIRRATTKKRSVKSAAFFRQIDVLRLYFAWKFAI